MNGNFCASDLSKMLSHKFNGEVLNIAYSTVGLAPINTAEHFHLACHLGFNAIKGDVRVTADGGLVMCHDHAFTMDENGRIARFDKTNCVPIRDMPFAQAVELEYAADPEVLGHYAKVCSFDTYIRICKENGKIPYITLRDYRIADLVKGVMEVLEKYRMTEHCVINSFTLETLQEVRKYSRTIPISRVLRLCTPVTKEAVDEMIPLGNAILTMFLYGGGKREPEQIAASKEALEYAREHDIQLYVAIVKSFADYTWLVQQGVQGVQIIRAYMPYNRSDFQFAIRVESGNAVFENLFGGDRLCADVTNENGTVTIRNIRTNQGGYSFDDGLPVLWLNRLPFAMDVTCSTNSGANLSFRENALALETGNVDGTYYIHVSV